MTAPGVEFEGNENFPDWLLPINESYDLTGLTAKFGAGTCVNSQLATGGARMTSSSVLIRTRRAASHAPDEEQAVG